MAFGLSFHFGALFTKVVVLDLGGEGELDERVGIGRKAVEWWAEKKGLDRFATRGVHDELFAARKDDDSDTEEENDA